MGILSSLLSTTRNATYNDRDGWFPMWLRGGEDSDTGISINEYNALKISTIWKCVNWRTKMFGMLPKKIYERTTKLGRPAQVEARNHPLYPLIHTSPNPTITSKAWFGLISADVHLWGNSYAYIERARGSARIVGLWRILPDAVRIETSNDGKDFWYWVRYGVGVEEKFLQDEIVHIRGLGFDGIRGYSPIAMERRSIAWSASTMAYSSKYYKNAFRPSGLLVAPAAMKPEQKKGLIDNLRAQGKDGGLALIEGALEYKPLTIPNDDAQFIETMNYQEQNICGIMEVYPHEIGIMDKLTFNNVEQLTISSITRNLQPFAIDVEQWLDLQLLSDGRSSGIGGGTERERYFHHCELKVLLRGDMAAQTLHVKEMIGSGVYAPNDGRDYLELPPYAGGDVYVINRAYGPVDSIDEWTMSSQNNPPAKPPAPAETPKPEPVKKAARLDAIKESARITFRDAVGRLWKRTKGRDQFAPEIFRAAFDSLAIAMGSEPAADFRAQYLGALGKRSLDWKESELNVIAAMESSRAFDELLEIAQAKEYFESEAK